jgi:hypothetical protein
MNFILKDKSSMLIAMPLSDERGFFVYYRFNVSPLKRLTELKGANI